MSKILELRNKRAKLYEQAKAYLEDHRGDNGLVSAEDPSCDLQLQRGQAFNCFPDEGREY